MEKQSRLVIGRTKLRVPVGDNELVYVLPAVGHGSYLNVGREILNSNLMVPTGELTAPFVRELYCGELRDEPQLVDARSRVRTRWLPVYQVNSHGFDGLFSVQDETVEGLAKIMDREALRQELDEGFEHGQVRFSKNGKVAFAPRGSYFFGEMTPDELAKDGAMIAQYKPEGARLLAQASASLPYKPISYGIDIQEGQDAVIRFSTLDENGGRLHFSSDYFDNDDNGFAFPVSAQ